MFGRGDGGFRLVEEAVILYEGEPSGVSLTHARVFESDEETAIVIVGELTDNPGMSVASSIEQVAATIDLRWFGGNGQFRLLAYDTDEQTFKEARFHGAGRGGSRERPLRKPLLDRDGHLVSSAITGVIPDRWQEPAWEFVSILDELGMMPDLFNPDEYTARSRGGEGAERVREEAVRLNGEGWDSLLDAAGE
jgi:hypothetical protein